MLQVQTITPRQKITREQLTNRLNVLHFHQTPILIVLQHRKFDYLLTLKATPDLCLGDKFRATWIKESNFPRNIHQFNLKKVILPEVSTALEIIPKHFCLEEESFTSEVPETIEIVSGRKVKRSLCSHKQISARLVQNSIGFSGNLIDFSPVAMRVHVETKNPQNFYWLNVNKTVMLTLEAWGGDVIYSGEMNILRMEGGHKEREIVLQPAASHTPRYRPKVARTKRQTMQPSPSVSFRHPLTGDNRTLKIRDIATLGFSVEEPADRSTLIAGLLLPNIELSVADSFFLACSGQVVYRTEQNGRARCGIAILDIDINDHYKLIGLVHQAEDEHAYLSTEANPLDFMEFFFKTGFLYPAKYAEVAADREGLLETYNKLYAGARGIARSFVYRKDGEMEGHISALRIYKYAWLNHHHAALTSRGVGLKVLRQISDFINDSYYLNPVQLRYVVGIWRPDNSFPAKFFGRFAKQAADPQKCSTDTFAYFRNSPEECQDWGELKGPWELVRAQESDIHEFCGFYNKMSGGLLAKAFDLTPETFSDTSVSEAYRESGLKRDRYLYAVRYCMDLKALVEVQDSDTGLNMSELTNAVTIFVLDQELFTPKTLEMVKCIVGVRHKKERHPIQLYPVSYMERYQLDFEKTYTTWILNLEYADEYMEYLNRLCR